MTSHMDDAQRQRVVEQLGRILSSSTFSGSERHRRFLSFVVEETLKGDTDKLNEFVLGFEVFNRGESFDPRVDSIVRVEARRLRERLKKYYEEEGRQDSLVITFRPRSFVPHFETRELKPEGSGRRPGKLVSRRALILIGVAVLAAVVTAVSTLVWRKMSPRPLEGPPSILVMPFQNLSSGEDKAHLGESMDDALITGLARIRGLRVISRGSVIQLSESGQSPVEMAASLGVDYIVDGTILIREDRVRISAKMTNVHTQSYIWAHSYERDAKKLIDVEQELAEAIASQIRVALAPDFRRRLERRRATTREAYAAFLKGQYFWYRFGEGGAEKSLVLFEKAIKEDPNYAPAWAWLSQSYHVLYLQSDGRNANLLKKGRMAAEKALALDSDLAEAQAAVAAYAALDWDWERADQGFVRALDLNPGWAHGHAMYATICLVPTGRLDEALRHTLRAIELDPMNQAFRMMLARLMYERREFQRSVAEFEEISGGRDAEAPPIPAYVLALAQIGKAEKTLPKLRSMRDAHPESTMAAAQLGYVLAQTDAKDQAREILNTMKARNSKTYVSPLQIALISIGIGDFTSAIDEIRLAVDAHIPRVIEIGVDPVYDPLRSDPRFAELVRRIGLGRILDNPLPPARDRR